KRDAVAVDVDAAVVRVGAADEQEAAAERRARQTGQGLDDADRIAEGARHRGELAPLEGAAGDLEHLALPLDHRLVRVAADRPHVEGDLDPLSLAELERAAEAVELLVHRDDGVGAGRHAVEVEAALLVGDRVEPELGDRHDHAGQLAAHAALERAPPDGDRLPHVAGVSRRRRPGLLLALAAGRRRRGIRSRLLHLGELEVDRGLDRDRPGDAVPLGRAEAVLARGGDRRLVEAVAGRPDHLAVGDRAGGVDRDAHLDRRLEAGGGGGLRVHRRGRLEELRRPGQDRLSGRRRGRVVAPRALLRLRERREDRAAESRDRGQAGGRVPQGGRQYTQEMSAGDLAGWATDLAPVDGGAAVRAPYRSYRETWLRLAALASAGRARARRVGESVAGEPLWAFDLVPPDVPPRATTFVMAGLHAMEHVGV